MFYTDGRPSTVHVPFSDTEFPTLFYLTFQTKLAWKSMNHGDVFILDLGLAIYVWNGKESGRLEKIKGLDVARRIRDEERGGRAVVEVVEEERMHDCEAFLKKMNAITDDTPRDIGNATDDATFERVSKDNITLYR